MENQTLNILKKTPLKHTNNLQIIYSIRVLICSTSCAQYGLSNLYTCIQKLNSTEKKVIIAAL